MQQPHRPGPLHQTNKPHKGSSGHHKRKSSAISEIKNKVISKSNHRQNARSERLNQLQQNRKLKWEKTVSQKRTLGSGSNPPLLVGVIGSSPKSFFNGLKDVENSDSITIKDINERSVYVISHRLKMRFKLVLLDQTNFDETLDIVKAIDLMILHHEPEELLQDDEFPAPKLLRTIYIHCMPSLIHVINGMGKDDTNLIIKAKRNLKIRVGDEKVQALENAHDYQQLFHIVGSCKRQQSLFKETRSIISADQVEVVDGCLSFLGYVRNKTLSPNDLVHVPGFDDYQIKRIDILPEVVSLRPTSIGGDQIVQTLIPDPMKQETLEQENDIDPMEGEQTWPTAEELAAEVERQNNRKVIKKLPPGMSEYQGAWIPDSDEEDDYDNEEDDEVPMEKSDESDRESLDSDEDMATANGGQNVETISIMDVDEYDKNFSTEKEMKALEKLKEARDNEMFPDEIDTPIGETARGRFARYRGLKSFRTSEWDPQENLPPDYSRIFQFQNFQHAKRRIINEEHREGADPGQYVRVYLSNVPEEVVKKILNKIVPPCPVALLKHERKMTVMNLLIKRLPDSNLNNPIKSKDELIFYVGFRRFKARPIFTAHSISSKFKYERFLRDDVAMVATMYAPITFPPAPVLVFRETVTGGRELVASGSVLDSNPNRLIIKRIRLSGHPYKIHSKSAVLRFMFFNSEDVMYFKPVELVTKYNRRGHITEPLGTHGHMKCTFDKKIRSDDCVFMNLYKRIFPKWNYTPISE